MMISSNVDSEEPLPDGWFEDRDENGRPFFINHETKTTTWLDPRKFLNPKNISKLSEYNEKTVDGNSQHATVVPNQSNIIDPLPPGWEESYDPKVGVFFIDHVNQRNQLEDPRIELQRRRDQQKAMLKSYLCSLGQNHLQNQLKNKEQSLPNTSNHSENSSVSIVENDTSVLKTNIHSSIVSSQTQSSSMNRFSVGSGDVKNNQAFNNNHLANNPLLQMNFSSDKPPLPPYMVLSSTTTTTAVTAAVDVSSFSSPPGDNINGRPNFPFSPFSPAISYLPSSSSTSSSYCPPLFLGTTSNDPSMLGNHDYVNESAIMESFAKYESQKRDQQKLLDEMEKDKDNHCSSATALLNSSRLSSCQQISMAGASSMLSQSSNTNHSDSSRAPTSCSSFSHYSTEQAYQQPQQQGCKSPLFSPKSAMIIDSSNSDDSTELAKMMEEMDKSKARIYELERELGLIATRNDGGNDEAIDNKDVIYCNSSEIEKNILNINTGDHRTNISITTTPTTIKTPSVNSQNGFNNTPRNISSSLNNSISNNSECIMSPRSQYHRNSSCHLQSSSSSSCNLTTGNNSSTRQICLKKHRHNIDEKEIMNLARQMLENQEKLAGHLLKKHELLQMFTQVTEQLKNLDCGKLGDDDSLLSPVHSSDPGGLYSQNRHRPFQVSTPCSNNSSDGNIFPITTTTTAATTKFSDDRVIHRPSSINSIQSIADVVFNNQNNISNSSISNNNNILLNNSNSIYDSGYGDHVDFFNLNSNNNKYGLLLDDEGRNDNNYYYNFDGIHSGNNNINKSETSSLGGDKNNSLLQVYEQLNLQFIQQQQTVKDLTHCSEAGLDDTSVSQLLASAKKTMSNLSNQLLTIQQMLIKREQARRMRIPYTDFEPFIDNENVTQQRFHDNNNMSFFVTANDPNINNVSHITASANLPPSYDQNNTNIFSPSEPVNNSPMGISNCSNNNQQLGSSMVTAASNGRPHEIHLTTNPQETTTKDDTLTRTVSDDRFDYNATTTPKNKQQHHNVILTTIDDCYNSPNGMYQRQPLATSSRISWEQQKFHRPPHDLSNEQNDGVVVQSIDGARSSFSRDTNVAVANDEDDDDTLKKRNQSTTLQTQRPHQAGLLSDSMSKHQRVYNDDDYYYQYLQSPSQNSVAVAAPITLSRRKMYLGENSLMVNNATNNYPVQNTNSEEQQGFPVVVTNSSGNPYHSYLMDESGNSISREPNIPLINRFQCNDVVYDRSNYHHSPPSYSQHLSSQIADDNNSGDTNQFLVN